MAPSNPIRPTLSRNEALGTPNVLHKPLMLIKSLSSSVLTCEITKGSPPTPEMVIFKMIPFALQFLNNRGENPLPEN